MQAIAKNLNESFANEQLPVEIFCKIWLELNIVTTSDLMRLFELIKPQIQEMIYTCQERIIINSNLPNAIVFVNKFGPRTAVDCLLVLKPEQVDTIYGLRDFYLNGSNLEADQVIDILVPHIRKWKGNVIIKVQDDMQLTYRRGAVWYTSNYSIKQIAKLEPQAFISTFGLQNILHALLVPGLHSIIFEYLPDSQNEDAYTLIVLLKLSCLLDNIDINNEEQVIDRLDQLNINARIDTSKSRIHHVYFAPTEPFESNIDKGTRDFLDVHFTARSIRRNNTSPFVNLKTMKIPINAAYTTDWDVVAPNLKSYVSYSKYMIGYYKELEENEQEIFAEKHPDQDKQFV